MPFVVLPSRKPEFWADVERHKKAAQRSEGKKKPEPVEAVPVKKAATKKAKK